MGTKSPPTFKRRDRTKVIVDILTEALKGANKTRLVYRSNLNFTLFKSYITFLIDKGLIEVINTPEGCYRTTGKGIEFLESYKKIRELTES